MGKDLKSKELGEGLSQRKDGYYSARFTSRTGKRKQKYFKKIQDAKKWLIDEQYHEAHNDIRCPEDMTLDAWYNFWIKHKENNIRAKTLLNYQTYYKQKIGRLSFGSLPFNYFFVTLSKNPTRKCKSYKSVTFSSDSVICFFISATSVSYSSLVISFISFLYF